MAARGVSEQHGGYPMARRAFLFGQPFLLRRQLSRVGRRPTQLRQLQPDHASGPERLAECGATGRCGRCGGLDCRGQWGAAEPADRRGVTGQHRLLGLAWPIAVNTRHGVHSGGREMAGTCALEGWG